MKATHQATGHIDMYGEMIYRHDTVQVVRTHQEYYAAPTAQEVRVLWLGGSWLLWYGARETEPLNHYGSKICGAPKTPVTMDVTKGCDNGCDKNIVTRAGCDNGCFVTRLSQLLS